MSLDHYATLGVPYNATPDEIRDAFFQLARQLHPDADPEPGSREQFIAVQLAHEVLSNPQKRAEYDASIPPELRSGPELSLNVRYSRTSLSRLSEPQLVYVLFEAFCTAELNPNALPPCHICLVLDRSTSMQGARMDMVKSSAMNLVLQLRTQDLLSVVAFSDRAEVIIPPTRAASIPRSDSRINLLQTFGGTEIFQGLSQGVEQLKLSSPSFSRHLILLTDGNTYGDEQKCMDLAREAAGEGITISTVGIGHEWNDTLMDQLAGLGGGNSTFINSGRELDQFIQHKMRDLESVYARGLRLEFTSTSGVELRYAFRLNPDPGPLPLSKAILLGDLSYYKNIGVLLEFYVPPINGQDRVNLAKGMMRMELPKKPELNARLLVDIYRNVIDSEESETPPPAIVEALSRLTLYRMQERVRKDVNAGRFEMASKRLQSLATHLLSQGERELAHTVLVEAEHIKQSRSFSKDGDKRIKYGTRAFLLPAGSEAKL